MRFNSKSDRDLAFEQALLRYDIIKKGLLKIMIALFRQMAIIGFLTYHIQVRVVILRLTKF